MDECVGPQVPKSIETIAYIIENALSHRNEFKVEYELRPTGPCVVVSITPKIDMVITPRFAGWRDAVTLDIMTLSGLKSFYVGHKEDYEIIEYIVRLAAPYKPVASKPK